MRRKRVRAGAVCCNLSRGYYIVRKGNKFQTIPKNVTTHITYFITVHIVCVYVVYKNDVYLGMLQENAL